MNRFTAAVFTILIALNARAANAHAALSPQEIMQKNEDARKIAQLTSDAQISTQTGGAENKSKTFSWWRKLGPDQVHYKTLTRFHSPAEVRDEGILFTENDGGTSEVLLYLPTYKKTRRVETQAQSKSFMGSAFSYSDITAPHLDEYSYTLLREEACPITAAVHCYVIESKPANDAVRDKTGYSKSRAWIRADNFMAERAENDDAQGQLWKELRASTIQEVDPLHHKWMALELKMDDHVSHQTTDLKFSHVKAGAAIADSTFTEQNLSRP